jgi:membrane protein YqaA with SNARE-associated domain
MKIFEPIYRKTLEWASHPKAEKILAVVSFAESSFFPIPVDVMLAPMALADRSKAWRYAFIAMVASVLGAIFGYLIGAILFDSIGQQLIETLHWQDKFELVKNGFSEYGVWIILIASFTPFPYKIVTISSGIFGIALLPFILLSIIGRGGRFFLVSGLVKFFGNDIENMLDKWVERIGWASFVLLVLAAVAYKTFSS